MTSAQMGAAVGGESRSRVYVCPNCREANMREFCRMGDVPVHNALLFADAGEAAACAWRPMVLGFCRSCGFVSNVVFDPAVPEYSDRYEDQQSTSPLFRAFQTALIERLIATYGVRGRSVVEIGCGPGDFLVELCRRGGNRGVGIDPRGGGADVNGADVRFVRELFSADRHDVPCDVLCCRHTLEHMHETGAMIGEVRRFLAERPGAIAFFEVPDAGRIWREAAFWDVYYEHCSYFTAGSLARLFRRHGFEVLEVGPVFGGQYLTIVARPTAEAQGENAAVVEESVNALEETLANFGRQLTQRIGRWRDRLDRLTQQGTYAALWGGASKCTSFLSAVNRPAAIRCVVNINPNQHGKFLPGVAKEIVSPGRLQADRPALVIVMNPAYEEEIRRDLQAMGVSAEVAGL